MGTIYKSHTDTPRSKLGLDYCKAKKLTKDLNTHCIQYATQLFKTKRKLGFHQHNANGTGGVSSRIPPDPHLDLNLYLIFLTCVSWTQAASTIRASFHAHLWTLQMQSFTPRSTLILKKLVLESLAHEQSNIYTHFTQTHTHTHTHTHTCSRWMRWVRLTTLWSLTRVLGLWPIMRSIDLARQRETPIVSHCPLHGTSSPLAISQYAKKMGNDFHICHLRLAG